METTDGKLINSPEVPKHHKEAVTNLSQDEPYYNMNHKNEKRGKAIIFNNINFMKIDNREDNDKYLGKFINLLDVELNFQVFLYTDQSYIEIGNIIEQASQDDYSNDDCILVAVFSCKSYRGIYANDYTYPSSTIWEPFTTCQTLIGKPKLFIFQTIPVSSKTITSTDSAVVTYTIPIMADLLIVHSEHDERQFVDSFCKVFSNKEKRFEQILLLMTFLIKDLSDTDKNNRLINFESTLTRLLFFHDKMYHGTMV